MKLGRHLPKVRDVLAQAGLLAQARYVERATLEAELACPLGEAPEVAPYFSMVLVVKGGDPWL